MKYLITYSNSVENNVQVFQLILKAPSEKEIRNFFKKILPNKKIHKIFELGIKIGVQSEIIKEI